MNVVFASPPRIIHTKEGDERRAMATEAKKSARGGPTPMKKSVSEGYKEEVFDLSISGEDSRRLRTQRSEPDMLVSIAHFDAIVEDPKVSEISIREVYAEMQRSRETEKAKKRQIEIREPTWDIVDGKYARRLETGLPPSLPVDPMVIEDPFLMVEPAPPTSTGQVSLEEDSGVSDDEEDQVVSKSAGKKKKAGETNKEVFAGVVIQSNKREEKSKEEVGKKVEEEVVGDEDDPKGKKKARQGEEKEEVVGRSSASPRKAKEA